ncbi:MAG: hypothetical protein NTV15_02840, partial [Candidatus Bathyarchaeota archaeon]|nr:hypothetical protein [Candidatus Bathyarchaeota archaeon]
SREKINTPTPNRVFIANFCILKPEEPEVNKALNLLIRAEVNSSHPETMFIFQDLETAATC